MDTHVWWTTFFIFGHKCVNIIIGKARTHAVRPAFSDIPRTYRFIQVCHASITSTLRIFDGANIHLWHIIHIHAPGGDSVPEYF